MKIVNMLVAGVLLSVASGAFAACPSEMPESMLMDCIIYEGAGDFSAADELIQEWQDSQKAEQQDNMSSQDKVSLLD